MSIFAYIGKRIRESRERYLVQEAEYVAEYKRCLEGTSEQQERRLATWDRVHSSTRTLTSKLNLI